MALYMLDIMLVTMDTALLPALANAEQKRLIALDAILGSLDRPLLAALTMALHADCIADTPALAPDAIADANPAIALMALAESIIMDAIAAAAPVLIIMREADALMADAAIAAMPADAVMADVPSMVM